MKKILFVIAAAAMMLVGCTKELTQKVDKIEKDLASLETRVAELEKSLNSEVANLKTLIDAVEKKIVVASATQTSNGWELVLTDGKKVTLTNGKDGANGTNGKDGVNGTNGKDGHTPVVGIKAENGVLYWTVDGEFILVDGAKVPATGAAGENGAAGADAPVPSFKIDENGHLWVTVGETKTDLGKVVGENGANGTNGDSWFSAVEIVDGNLVVTLADGETTLTLPVYNEFGIALEATSIELGGTAAVKYTVTGDSEDVVVRAYAAEGWKAAVDAKKAVVNVTAPADQALYRAGWIDVYAIDNETGKVVAKSMTFSNEGTTLKVDEKVVVPAAGAEAIEVAVSTDYVYDVECEAEWLTLVPATKAVRNETLVFKAVANKSGANRTAEVNLTVDGVVKATVVFEQRALATAMTVTPAEAVLVIGDASIDFNAVVTPADADQAVTYAVLGEDGKPSTNLIFVGSELMLNDAEGSEDYLNVMPGEYTVVVTSVSNPEVKVEVPVEVKAILVEEIKVASELVRVKIGQTVALDYTVLPADASDKTVKFVSSDENIIKVDAEGNVTAVAAGEAKVTITSYDNYANNAGEDYVIPTAEVVFAVSNELAVTTLAFANAEADLHIAGTLDATVTAAPAAATNKAVEYAVLKDGKATTELVVVDGKVKVNPQATDYLNVIAGKTYTVVATSVENPTVKAEMTVNVYANYVESVALDAAELVLDVATDTTIVATVAPTAADDKTVKWYSSNTAVATVDANGKVTAVAVGNAVITCESMDKFNVNKTAPIKAECKVFVKEANMEYAVTAISFAAESVELPIDNTTGVALNPEFNPADAPAAACTWTVKDAAGYTTNQLVVKDGKVFVNPEVFAVFQDYAMVGKTYTVIATSNYDAKVSASIEVDVTAVAVTSLTLGAETLVMKVGETYAMKYTLGPNNATDKTVKWDVFKGDAVTVDENGVVKAVKVGKAVVRLQSMSKYNTESAPVAYCEIDVPPTAIAFEKEAYTVVLGKTLQLAAVNTPASDLAVKYEIVSPASQATSDKFTMTEAGLVTAVGYWPYYGGEDKNVYTVKVSYVEYPEISATATVTVDQHLATACSVSFESMTMKVGDTFRPSVNVVPADATNADLYRFAASGTTYGAVKDNRDGSFTAVKAGTYTLTISMDGAYMSQPPFTTFTLVIEE
jgi:uncharacterized protein YjdB/outer membrane murein-binding lipoprotein Lpp